MKKMTAEELRRMALLTREWSAQGGMIPSQQLILDLQQHIAALEAEAAQARERALEEAAGLISAWMAVDEHGRCEERMATRIRALKSKPAQEAPRDMSRDCTCLGSCRGEDGLGQGWRCVLKTKPRREHEYGEEYKGDFGSKVANCTRGRCQAYRVRSCGGKHVSFYQRPYHTPTDEPGPCEVEP